MPVMFDYDKLILQRTENREDTIYDDKYLLYTRNLWAKVHDFHQKRLRKYKSAAKIKEAQWWRDAARETISLIDRVLCATRPIL